MHIVMHSNDVLLKVDKASPEVLEGILVFQDAILPNQNAMNSSIYKSYHVSHTTVMQEHFPPGEIVKHEIILYLEH